jgi:hypothetical protein
MMERRLFAVWTAFALSALVALGEILVCPKCGHENDPRGTECVHCHARLSPAAPAGEGGHAKRPAAKSVFDASGKLKYLGGAVVDDDVALGREQVAKGKLDLARFVFLNAAALDTLTSPDGDEARGEQILELIHKCMPAGTVTAPCPACGGTGRRTVKRTDAQGMAVFKERAGRVCGTCAGTGKVALYGHIEERKFERGRAENEYRMIQQGRKYVPVGRAWVPQEVADKLTGRQTAALRRAVAEPCRACTGFGRTDCTACRGKGYLPCPERNCTDGTAQVELKSSWNKKPRYRQEKCSACRGTGKIACDKCEGRGSLVCAACQGSGQRADCTRCGGEGAAPCKRCNGTGTDRGGACAACSGEGVTLCSGCGGDGRKR